MSERLGLEFLVDRSQVVDRLLSPVGGIALVELEQDPQSFLNEFAAGAEALIPETASERSFDWSCRRDWHGNMQQALEDDHDLLKSFPDLADSADDLSTELHGIYDEVLVAASSSLSPYFRLDASAQRRTTSSRNGHTDDTFLTSWLGATKPGLVVFWDNKSIPVDNIPPGHALVWRGNDLHIDKNAQAEFLPPIHHRVNYRSKSRRFRLIGLSG